jgi:leucyl-tRNA synthetase
MSTTVIVLGAQSDDAQESRLRAVAGAYRRLAALGALAAAGGQAPGPEPLAGVLSALAKAGRLVVEGSGPWQLSYVPSQASLGAVAEGTAPSWGARIDAKQQKAPRRVRGAIFRLPYADGAGEVTAFITDWSPFTAACALAVHADHEAAADKSTCDTPFFSGKFARHPLHGDLLPIWVADWVKPEFGTGAVIVNPAHSEADLEFARTVGLPVRFGLGAAEPTADPATWLDPPVVKSGQAVRAGQYSGLGSAAAAAAYFRDLSAAGHAEQASLLSFGRAPLATLALAAEGELTWSPSRRARGLADTDEGVTVAVKPTPLLSAAASLRTRPAVVATAQAVTGDLLWLRLLAADLGVDVAPASVVPVAKVSSVKDVSPESLEGSLAVACRPDEVAAVTAQLGQQVARMVGEHAGLSAQLSAASGGAGHSKATAKAREALFGGDFPTAFADAAATAKAARRGGPVSAAERDEYLLAMHVLFGLHLPTGVQARQPTEGESR